MTIQDRLAEYLKVKSLTNRDFERLCALSNGTAARLRETTRKSTFDRIANACDLNIDWLRRGEGNMISHTPNKGNYLSPESIYMEGSEIVIGDPVLRERIKHLQASLNNLQGEKKIWDFECKAMKNEIESLRSRNEALNVELSKTKDRIIELLTEHKCK